MTIPEDAGTPRNVKKPWQFIGRDSLFSLLLVAAVLTLILCQTPRALRVDVGSAEDRGLTLGFNDRESNAGFDFRWSRAESEVLLPSLASGKYTLSIGAAAPHPDGSVANVDLLLDGRPFDSITVGPAYQRFSFTISIPPGLSGTHSLLFRTKPARDPNNNSRMIGVAVDDVALRAMPWPMLPPLFPLLALLADAALFYRLLQRWVRKGAFLATVVAIIVGTLYLLALRHPLGPAVYQLFIPIAFVYGAFRCAEWALRHRAQPAWVIGAVGALAFAALSAADYLLHLNQVSKPTDFLIFYRAATAAWTGHPLTIYDLPAIRANPLQGVVFRQPPVAAAMIAPLAPLSFSTALLVWRAILVGFIILSIGMLARHLGLPRIGKPAGWPVVALVVPTLLWAPLRVSISGGQWDPILLFLLVVAFIALRRGSPPVAGFAIALAGIIKIYPLYLGLFLLWKREWRALAWLVGSLVALTVAGILTTGWHTTVIYAKDVVPIIGGSTTFAQNQSLISFPLRLAGIDQATGLKVTILAAVTLAAVTALISWRLRTHTERDSLSYALGYAMTICAMLLVVPVAWDHYETVLLIPLAIMLVMLTRSVPSLSPTWLMVAAGALGLLIFGEARDLPSALTAKPFQYEDLTRAVLVSARVFAQVGFLFVLWHLAGKSEPGEPLVLTNDTVAEAPRMTEALTEA